MLGSPFPVQAVLGPTEVHSENLNPFHTVLQLAPRLEYEIQWDFELFLRVHRYYIAIYTQKSVWNYEKLNFYPPMVCNLQI